MNPFRPSGASVAAVGRRAPFHQDDRIDPLVDHSRSQPLSLELEAQRGPEHARDQDPTGDADAAELKGRAAGSEVGKPGTCDG